MRKIGLTTPVLELVSEAVRRERLTVFSKRSPDERSDIRGMVLEQHLLEP
jgi:hypothetical protein